MNIERDIIIRRSDDDGAFSVSANNRTVVFHNRKIALREAQKLMWSLATIGISCCINELDGAEETPIDHSVRAAHELFLNKFGVEIGGAK